MDYKEKYDALLEKAREMMNNESSSEQTKVICQEFFPELAESEDERIRKEIISFIETEACDSPISKNWIAYLKKQKEQKPGEQVDAYYQRGFNKGYGLGLETGRKQNKPTPDWMPKFLNELRSMKHHFDYDEHRHIEGQILAIINWIAPNYFDKKEKEQKPIPALDRGDEIILKAICEELKDAPGWVERIEGWYRLAKDAQQPVEWSEEDEKQLNWFYRLLDFIGEEFPSTWGQNHKGGKEWLKSRRPQPQWKPSEEQMLALKRAIEEMEKIDSNTASTLALLKFDPQNS